MKNNIKYILIITILLGGLLLHTKVGLAACLDKNNIANSYTESQCRLPGAQANGFHWENPTTPNPMTPTIPTPATPESGGIVSCTPPKVLQGSICVNPSSVLCDDFGQPAGCVDSTQNTTCTPDENGTLPAGCGGYNLLVPIPCPAGSNGCVKGADGQYTLTNFDPASTDGPNTKLGEYLNLMIKIFIGLCAVAAVGMIVIGGVEYMTSELISGKEAGKERIEHAILGLVIALSSYALLNTINPNILNTDLESLKGVKVNVNIKDYQGNVGDIASTVSVPIQTNALQSLGITDCTGSGGQSSVTKIAQEFIGRTNYSMANRNTVSGSIINLDCSSFVDQVYKCAGLSSPGITSANIANVANSTNGNRVDGRTFDFNTLQPGDVVGWENNAAGVGHVAIYIGNGQLIDTNSKGNTQVLPVSIYRNRITFVRRP